MKPLLLSLLALIFASCWRPARQPEYTKVWGYRPVYTDSVPVSFDAPRTMTRAGKIYVKDNFIYQLDENSGVHVFDKSDSSELKNLGFINIQGASEISISGEHLITNSFSDLIVLDISNLSAVKLVSRVKHAFASAYDQEGYVPTNLPDHNVYYECIQGNKGTVKEWVRDSVYNICYFN